MLSRLRALIAVALILFGCAAAAQTTTLAPGDRLLIALPGEAEFAEPFAIDISGRVLLPEIGEVELAGLSPPEAEARLRTALAAAFVGAPQLELRLVERRVLVRVLGYVERPGVVDIARGETVQVAVEAAGGVRLGAQLDRLIHRRAGAETSFDYKRYLESGDEAGLPALESLDTLFVPASPLLGNVAVAVDASTFQSSGDSGDADAAVSVFGEVARPGVYGIKPGMTVLDAILRAGGVTRYAGVEQIRVIRGDEPTLFNLKAFLDSGDRAGLPVLEAGRPASPTRATCACCARTGAWRASTSTASPRGWRAPSRSAASEAAQAASRKASPRWKAQWSAHICARPRLARQPSSAAARDGSAVHSAASPGRRAVTSSGMSTPAAAPKAAAASNTL
jgi:protein involved in polysaccharide export with SLBB domain